MGIMTSSRRVPGARPPGREARPASRGPPAVPRRGDGVPASRRNFTRKTNLHRRRSGCGHRISSIRVRVCRALRTWMAHRRPKAPRARSVPGTSPILACRPSPKWVSPGRTSTPDDQEPSDAASGHESGGVEHAVEISLSSALPLMTSASQRMAPTKMKVVEMGRGSHGPGQAVDPAELHCQGQRGAHEDVAPGQSRERTP